jgi:transcriptional regulator with XRE-family HTH domain
MAKTKVRSHPEALWELLKKMAMTQMDAANVTGVDRKTLAKINRGEEVKLETLQKVAKKLKAPLTQFEPSITDSRLTEDLVGNRAEDASDPQHSLMLREVDASALAEMLKEAQRLRWQLNIQGVDEKTRESLEQFEDAVKELRQHLQLAPLEVDDEEADSLRLQLLGLKKVDRVTELLEALGQQHSLGVLGADYLFWERTFKQKFYHHIDLSEVHYTSQRIVLLSIEPSGTQFRRVRVSPGQEPPKFAGGEFAVLVDGRALEGPPPPPDIDDDEEIPF